MTNKERIRQLKRTISNEEYNLQCNRTELERLEREEKELRTGDVVAFLGNNKDSYYGKDMGLNNRQIFFRFNPANDRRLKSGKGYVLCEDGTICYADYTDAFSKLGENVFIGE